MLETVMPLMNSICGLKNILPNYGIYYLLINSAKYASIYAYLKSEKCMK